LEKLIEMCDTVEITASPADNTMLLSIIYSKLEGRAFEFCREATYADWPALKTALQRKFAPAKSVAQLKQEHNLPPILTASKPPEFSKLFIFTPN
jgi:hypothetical protein